VSVRSECPSATLRSVRTKDTKRLRLWLIVSGALALVMAANWIAVPIHIGNLRENASRSSGDAVPELLAQVDDFRPAENVFGVFTILLSLTSLLLVARVVRRRGHSAGAIDVCQD
jgi:hypothetical protein